MTTDNTVEIVEAYLNAINCVKKAAFELASAYNDLVYAHADIGVNSELWNAIGSAFKAEQELTMKRDETAVGLYCPRSSEEP